MGAALVGFADLRALPEEVRHGLPYGISFAVAVDAEIVADVIDGPTVEYAGEYERTNDMLDQMGEAVAEMLRAEGHQAVAVPATSSVGLDLRTLSSVLPHKTVATRAGLGWIGKCALLITEEYGSAIRLATVLTDAEVCAAEPVDESRCGDCTACLDVCPTDAPTGELWEAGVPRERILDAFACMRMAKEMAGRVGVRHIICGMCIAACPWTRRYLECSR
jgi:epoxyqueuosine reductase QueG